MAEITSLSASVGPTAAWAALTAVLNSSSDTITKLAKGALEKVNLQEKEGSYHIFGHRISWEDGLMLAGIAATVCLAVISFFSWMSILGIGYVILGTMLAF